MKSIFVLSLTIIFLSGCSLYKSEGRKEFESNAPGKVKTSSTEIFQLKGCKKESSLESWFNAEFPAASYELVVAENDLEVWRTTHPGTVEVKAIQKTETSTQSCLYEFSTKAVWDGYKEQFIRELENNLMTQD
ncbi:hypothetical protein [Bdellovibrio svalbardensis]|uniref:Lipoprotein n=1 Tax=Bdellovibrio svalbardensis TaxID=2972972 RepID=A0ABT6DLI7_9BACT|nr:hypothetical protein [Bdellovibrio svalbardensis]MDG0817449.1 hypothetical protein [Bdellovibrio svalbardensis]